MYCMANHTVVSVTIIMRPFFFITLSSEFGVLCPAVCLVAVAERSEVLERQTERT
jgi:hypothetical protein